MNNNAYLQDQYLRPLLPNMGDFDLFSFDIFDTLLLRDCDQPQDVFTRVGKRLRREGLLDYAPATYRALREEAERRARQVRQARDGSREVRFEEIFDVFPFNARLREVIMAYELEAEAKALYLNPNVFSFIQHCKSLGKRVALISNMYLSEERILALLQGAGFDTLLLDAFFVSCEHGVDKNGGLFEAMLARFPDLLPGRAIHIGDQPHADAEGARAAGMHAALYGLVTRNFADPFEMETKKYGSDLGAISSLRKLAGASHNHALGSEEAFFHKLGAEVFGPVYALFAEWIVLRALRSQARVILPFMREGELIAQLVQSVLNHREIPLACTPWSISRRPAFAASLYEDNVSQKVYELAYKSNCTLEELFRQLGLEAIDTPFAVFSRHTITQLRGEGHLDAIVRYFVTTAREPILSFAASQRTYLLSMLDELTGGQKSITVDLGTKASTAAHLDTILAREGRPELSHALLLGADAKNVDNILNGMDIYAWLGLAGENSVKITRLIYPLTVLEALLNATCGTVLYYREGSSGVESVLEENIHSAHEKKMIAALWEGVRAFQWAWLALDGQKGLKDNLIATPEYFLNILVRFIDMPTSEEAVRVGGIRYYDALTDKEPMPLCGTALDPALSDEKIDALLASSAWNDSIWPQATVARTRPQYFISRYIRETSDDPFVRLSHRILMDAQAMGHTYVAVYALTENARSFARIADIFGCPIYCFVDGNPHLHGTWAEGKQIMPLAALDTKVDAFVIASVYSADEIKATIRAHYASGEKQPAIYDFTGKE